MAATDDTDLHDLVLRARGGDPDAYGAVVLRLSSWLRMRLRRYVAGDDDALDDLVQDTFVRAWERLEDFDPERSFEPWIARIGVNLALDRRRSASRRDEVDDAEPWLDAIAVPADAPRAVDDAEMLAEVERALADLPAGWVLVLRLRAVEEMSTTEIASALDLPLGTVLSRLSRARARIAIRLAERYGDPRAPEEGTQ